MITPAEVVVVTTDEIDVYLTTIDRPDLSLSTDEITVTTDEIDVYYVPRGVNR